METGYDLFQLGYSIPRLFLALVVEQSILGHKQKHSLRHRLNIAPLKLGSILREYHKSQNRFEWNYYPNLIQYRQKKTQLNANKCFKCR
jgi:hypothetical protein